MTESDLNQKAQRGIYKIRRRKIEILLNNERPAYDSEVDFVKAVAAI